MKYARRIDANQTRIVQALRQLGFSVLDLSKVGGGCADLAVRHGDGPVWFIEVKNPDGRNRVSDGQAAFAEVWPVKIIRTVEEAVKWARTV